MTPACASRPGRTGAGSSPGASPSCTSGPADTSSSAGTPPSAPSGPWPARPAPRRCTSPRTPGPTAPSATTTCAPRSADDDVELRPVGTPYAVPPGTLFTGGRHAVPGLHPVLPGVAGPRLGRPARRAPRASGGSTDVRSDDRPEAPDGHRRPAPTGGGGRSHAGWPRSSTARSAATPTTAIDRAIDGTSRLSPYLKWGCVHPRQVLARLGRGKGPQAFATELCLARLLRRRPAPPARVGPPEPRRAHGRHRARHRRRGRRALRRLVRGAHRRAHRRRRDAPAAWPWAGCTTGCA